MQSNKGITMIALIVTILVLLILASVGVVMILGDGGILNKASSSKEETEKGEALEHLKIEIMDANTNKISTENNKLTLNDVKSLLSVDSEVQDLELVQGDAQGNYYVIGRINNNDFYIDSNLNINLEKLDINYNSTLTGQTITSDSIINAISNTKITTGYYTLNINSISYNIHLYVYDGDQTWDSMTFGDANDVATASAEATNMVVVKVNGNLTVNSGATITSYGTAYGGPKGMFIYCTGTLINNGTITMSARGAKATGQNIYLWKNEDASYEYVPAVGASGAAGGYQSAGGTTNGSNGGNGTKRSTGGGGSGQRNYGTGGAGGKGTSYSGGAGGGGRWI